MNRLKELRREKKLTQKELADKLYTTKMSVSRWENGESQIKPEKAQALADFFGVSVGYLLGYGEELMTFSSGKEFEEYRKKLLETVEPNLETIKRLYDLVSDKDFQENLKAQQEAYKFLEEYFDNPDKWDRFIKNIVHHPSYLVYIQGLIENDKQDGTKEADLLINYLLLDETDKKLVLDLIEKLANKDN